jgi:phosphoglycerate dehydrogenase-like enzyme
VVDTDALVASARDGLVRAALDVTDPEPLPADHPLWTTPGILITPHVGGHSTAMAPRVERLIREQAARLVRGEEPLSVVLRS